MEFITDESLNNRNEQPNKHTNIDNITLYKKLLQIENEIHHLKREIDNINYIHYPRPLRPYFMLRFLNERPGITLIFFILLGKIINM